MNKKSIERILRAFADKPEDVDLSKGTILAQFHEELIEGRLVQEHGETFVIEADEKYSFNRWVIERIARMRLLSERICETSTTWKDTEFFIQPAGNFVEEIEGSSSELAKPIEDVEIVIKNYLQNRVPGISRVLYVTSDAG
jgi:tRNA(Glu) U13 pseudouridine synthase TruD